MTLTRIGWLLTVAVCVIVAVALLFADYHGYAAVAGAVGLAASINLAD